MTNGNINFGQLETMYLCSETERHGLETAWHLTEWLSSVPAHTYKDWRVNTVLDYTALLVLVLLLIQYDHVPERLWYTSDLELHPLRSRVYISVSVNCRLGLFLLPLVFNQLPAIRMSWCFWCGASHCPARCHNFIMTSAQNSYCSYILLWRKSLKMGISG